MVKMSFVSFCGKFEFITSQVEVMKMDNTPYLRGGQYSKILSGEYQSYRVV